MSNTSQMNTELALACLINDERYRVLTRFTSRDSYGDAPGGVRLSKGVILDTETTGTNASEDKVIELGLIVFEYDALTGTPYRILAAYNSFEDPGIPIPAGATRVNGITDEMVLGHRIDDQRVKDLVEDADIVIAHNSRFDRAVMERRMPFFKTMPWGCSLTQIKWEAEDIPSAKLGYICYTYGFFFEAHRAEADCRALLEMLHYPLPVSGITGLKAILNEYQKEEVSLAAVNSPFHSKDALKARGYRWEGTEKFWHTSLSAELLDDETAWLRAIVHGGRPFQMGISKVSAFNRFSDRPIQREMIPG